MFRTRKATIGLLVVLALVSTGLVASIDVFPTSSSSSGIQHVILIMMENQNYQNIIGNPNAPYTNKLANSYALATNFYGIEYPSLPNYIDISSGNNGGITTDCLPSSSCGTSQSNIYTLLQSSGLSWKAYEESMPSACSKSDSGSYITHHNPIPYFTDLSSVCSQNDIPLGDVSTKTGAFFAALDSNSLPSFSFITPNGCDDMHGVSGVCSSSISTGDSWLSQIVPDILNSPSYSTTVTIITWDTGDCSSPCNQNLNGGGKVITLVIGPSYFVNYGKFSTFYNHYSTLATIEKIFHLGNLGRNDASATPMTAIVNTNAIGSSSTTTTSTNTATSSSSLSSSTASSSSTSSTSNSSSVSSSSISTSSSSSYSSSSSSSSMSSSSESSTLQPSSSITSVSSSSSSNQGQATSNRSSSLGSNTTISHSPSVSITSLYQSAVATFATLSPSKNPPLWYGFSIYELCLFGSLGYAVLVFRKGPKEFWRW